MMITDNADFMVLKYCADRVKEEKTTTRLGAHKMPSGGRGMKGRADNTVAKTFVCGVCRNRTVAASDAGDTDLFGL